MMKEFTRAAVVAAALLATGLSASAKTALTMYYPISVGGPLTKVIDGMISKFQTQNPDVEVKAIYAGNYDDTRVKALSAIKSGEPAQLSVLFSIDA
jgi:sn-glycerol 3-phosphate transport system substrate-binding protein